MEQAKFNIGQVIRHLRFDYRGVVVDIDPVFSGTEEWYERVAKSRPPKDRPWYHVLVDDDAGMTYVAERHLAGTSDTVRIRHPLLEEYLERSPSEGRYISRRTLN